MEGKNDKKDVVSKENANAWADMNKESDKKGPNRGPYTHKQR